MVDKLETAKLQLAGKNQELQFLASRDPLTNCYNRRSLYEYLDIEYEKVEKYGPELSCIMVDIDHFKNINDSYGHGAGDEIIKLMAETLNEEIREKDVVGRYGGEEFCILLPNTPINQARKIAERCRTQLSHKDYKQIQVTASFGVSSTKTPSKNGAELIQKADEALYYSKENGRNKVTNWRKDINEVSTKQAQEAATVAATITKNLAKNFSAKNDMGRGAAQP
jgi:diguanylate cyclase (GGDEF)-like protein